MGNAVLYVDPAPNIKTRSYQMEIGYWKSCAEKFKCGIPNYSITASFGMIFSLHGVHVVISADFELTVALPERSGRDSRHQKGIQ